MVDLWANGRGNVDVWSDNLGRPGPVECIGAIGGMDGTTEMLMLGGMASGYIDEDCWTLVEGWQPFESWRWRCGACGRIGSEIIMKVPQSSCG